MSNFDKNDLEEPTEVILILLCLLVAIGLHITSESLLQKLQHRDQHPVKNVKVFRSTALSDGRQSCETCKSQVGIIFIIPSAIGVFYQQAEETLEVRSNGILPLRFLL